MVYLSQLFTSLMVATKELFSRFNWVDIFVLIILFRTSYIGIRKGLFLEIVKAIGLLAGLVILITQYERIGYGISERFQMNRGLSNGVGAVGMFAAGYLGIRFFGFCLEKILKIEAKGFWNRFWGAGVGLIRGTVLAASLLTATLLVNSGYLTESIQEKSLLAPRLVMSGSTVYRSLHQWSVSFAIKGSGQNVSDKPKASE